MNFYWELNAPSTYRGASTRPGCQLSLKEMHHFNVRAKIKNGECTVPYITTKKPKVKLEPPKGGDK
jgi:hypothetical protein